MFFNKIMILLSSFFFFTSLILKFKSMFILINIPLLSFYFFSLPISIIIDWFSMIFLATVLFITSMILKFSMSYIPKPQHNIFFLFLMMFVLSMMILILSNNVFFILLGWDGLGLSSYILVIFYQNSSSSASGSITILSNRIGDIMILLSISILFSLSFWNFSMNEFFPKIILMFLTIAAMSKSAQFPFSAWLPAAMAAPTPISALVHSSTLVTAGIYLLIRILNISHPFSMNLLLLMSSFTVIFSSFSALWEQDMKKIIALSTLSQMAMMMFSISLNSANSAFFHLISHALFKSMMFLCAGIMIHNFMYQDMRHMGSIFSFSPITTSMLGISNLSLMGIPFMSGFFSKDMIIEKLINSKLLLMINFLMIFSISLTSMYSFRSILMSIKFSLKSKPDMTIKWNKNMENSTIIMSLFPILMGIMFSWMFIPNQNFMLPMFMKILIITSLMMGILMSMSSSWKNKMYLNLGESAISLWFSHFITSIISIPSNFLMINFSKNDKNWQENYGPTFSFYNFMKMSSLPDKITFTSLMIIMMIILSPIFMF